VRPRRILIVLDARAPLDVVDREIGEWRTWAAESGVGDLALGRIVFGKGASWVPDDVSKLAGSAAARGAGNDPRPALREALELVAAHGADAAVTLLAGEPAPGWEGALTKPPNFRACVTMSPEPARALGRGYLGAAFRGEHLDLALRWVTRELYDRTWRCACGTVRVYPDDIEAPCAACGAASDLPPRLRIGDRVVLMTAGAQLFPHHVGRQLNFERPLRALDDVVPRDGTLDVDGVVAEIRTGRPARTHPPRSAHARARRFRPPPLRTTPDRCYACEGPLVPPVQHEAPDPRRFCFVCAAAEPRCDFCGVPVGTGGGNRWPDGRKACRDCWSTAVTTTEQLAALAAMGRTWLKERLSMETPDCPLYLDHAAAIARMHGRTFRPLAGFNPRPIGFFRKPVNGQTAAVFLEHGTPRGIAYGVVVHELTHHWQWECWAHDRAPTLVEGLAMWVEYHALLDAGAIFAARHAERYGDPVYGLGFRIALALEKEVGFEKVKERMHDVSRITVSSP
jgi:hypothetical protein